MPSLVLLETDLIHMLNEIGEGWAFIARHRVTSFVAPPADPHGVQFRQQGLELLHGAAKEIGRRGGLPGMRNNIEGDVGIAHDDEVKSPVPIDSRLPYIVGFVVFLRVQRGDGEDSRRERRLA
jgi:hypothetical protein